jgi:hypothetical protein
MACCLKGVEGVGLGLDEARVRAGYVDRSRGLVGGSVKFSAAGIVGVR